MKKNIAILLSAVLLALSIGTAPLSVYADAAPGDVIVSLGENLSPAQKEKLLAELEVPSDALTVTVSNKEEHEYLGDYIPKAQIGTKALSSAKITIGEKNTGIIVQTNNINWVSNEMYANALATAGVVDASVMVTAPFEVSGTAGLTGIFKAYEKSTGEKIPEETKQAANQEMVTTAQLGEEIGKDEASALVTAIKGEIAEDMPKNAEEMQQVIEQKAEELNIPIDAAQTEQLTELFGKLKELDINWNAVGDQLGEAKEKLEGFINSDEGRNFFESVGQFVKDVFQAILDFFGNLFGGKEEESTESGQ